MLYIHGIGHAHPETEISNDFLEKLGSGLSASSIADRLGILSRRSVLPLDYISHTFNANPKDALLVASHTPTRLGAAAAQMALERAGIVESDVDLVIANCCTPVETMPAEAQRIAAHLQIHCKAFDVFSASSGFALHLDYLRSLRPEMLPRFTLCVCTATFTTVVNYHDAIDAAIWGDGAAAWIVSAKRPDNGMSVLHTCYGTEPRRCETVIVERTGHFRQNGVAVGHFSIGQTSKVLRTLRSNFDFDWRRTYFIGHQANARMLNAVCRSEGIPSERHLSNVAQIGNQAGAGAPATLSMNWDRLERGALAAVVVVGAGLSWGSVLLQKVD
jgi:3-oxoacyl-[acyl-carrier-protein] synthase III